MVDDPTFAAFTAWLRAQGVRWDDAALELLPCGAAAGGGVRARVPLASGTVVCAIPKAAALTVRSSPIADVLRAHGVRASEACDARLARTGSHARRCSWARRAAWGSRWR